MNTPEAIVFTGMRRVGKTTILKHIFDSIDTQNKYFFDFENPFDRKKFEKTDYNQILKGLDSYEAQNDKRIFIFIDEVQNFPQISKIIKYLIDHHQIKFFVTGSSSYYLRNLFPESLSGRKFVFDVFPLTFTEFLEFKNEKVPSVSKDEITHIKYKDLYEEYMNWGGFPEVVIEKDPEIKKSRLENIFKSYFENDVKKLADFKNLSAIRDLIILLASQVGSKTDVAKLASTLGLTRSTIYNYLNFLEATYVITLLPQFSQNAFRKSAGSKKVYFCDSGLANFVTKMSDGQLFEQSVFQNLRVRHKLAYFDKGHGSEIDFVVDAKQALEAKITATPKYIDNLKRRSTGIGIDDYKIVTLNYSELDKTFPALNLVE